MKNKKPKINPEFAKILESQFFHKCELINVFLQSCVGDDFNAIMLQYFKYNIVNKSPNQFFHYTCCV